MAKDVEVIILDGIQFYVASDSSGYLFNMGYFCELLDLSIRSC